MAENSENSLLVKCGFSFRSAYDSVPRSKLLLVREEIKIIFGVSTNKAMYDRIAGRPEPKVSEAKAIEQLFKSYGIKVVWGS